MSYRGSLLSTETRTISSRSPALLPYSQTSLSVPSVDPQHRIIYLSKIADYRDCREMQARTTLVDAREGRGAMLIEQYRCGRFWVDQLISVSCSARSLRSTR